MTNDYIFLGGQRIARRDASGNIFTYLADRLGSLRKMMEVASGGSSSTTAYDADFYPFGRENVFVSGTPIYKFTGKERDTESGNDYFGARYDSSTIGRFISPDPDNAGESDDDPQTWNAYSYVRNNPLNATDPDWLHCVVMPDGTYKDVGTDGQSCAEANSASQNNKPSSIVNGDETDQERIQDLAHQIAALTSARSLADLAQHGIGWAMTFEGGRGLLEIPGAINDALEAAQATKDRPELVRPSGRKMAQIIARLGIGHGNPEAAMKALSEVRSAAIARIIRESGS
jgi:RHS repeat-associated protein